MAVAGLPILWAETEPNRRRFFSKPELLLKDHDGRLAKKDYDESQPLRSDGITRDRRRTRGYSFGARSAYPLQIDARIIDIEPCPDVFKDHLPLPLQIGQIREGEGNDGYTTYRGGSEFMQRIIWNDDPPIFCIEHTVDGLTKELPQNTRGVCLEITLTMRRKAFGILPLHVSVKKQKSQRLRIH